MDNGFTGNPCTESRVPWQQISGGRVHNRSLLRLRKEIATRATNIKSILPSFHCQTPMPPQCLGTSANSRLRPEQPSYASWPSHLKPARGAVEIQLSGWGMSKPSATTPPEHVNISPFSTRASITCETEIHSDTIFKPWTTSPPKLFSSYKGWDGWTRKINPPNMTCPAHLVKDLHLRTGISYQSFPQGLNGCPSMVAHDKAVE